MVLLLKYTLSFVLSLGIIKCENISIKIVLSYNSNQSQVTFDNLNAIYYDDSSSFPISAKLVLIENTENNSGVCSDRLNSIELASYATLVNHMSCNYQTVKTFHNDILDKSAVILITNYDLINTLEGL